MSSSPSKRTVTTLPGPAVPSFAGRLADLGGAQHRLQLGDAALLLALLLAGRVVAAVLLEVALLAAVVDLLGHRGPVVDERLQLAGKAVVGLLGQPGGGARCGQRVLLTGGAADAGGRPVGDRQNVERNTGHGDRGTTTPPGPGRPRPAEPACRWRVEHWGCDECSPGRRGRPVAADGRARPPRRRVQQGRGHHGALRRRGRAGGGRDLHRRRTGLDPEPGAEGPHRTSRTTSPRSARPRWTGPARSSASSSTGSGSSTPGCPRATRCRRCPRAASG